MRIQAILFAALTGCDLKPDDSATETVDTCYGTPIYPHEFSIDQGVSSELLSQIMERYGVSDPNDLTCAQLCTGLVEVQEFSAVDRIDSCTHDVFFGDTASEPTAALTCTGEATTYCEGRRPLGHVEVGAELTLGGFLAHCAHLEAASVVAFEQLAAQLGALGAPASLIARCRQAAAEERDHAVAVGLLARQHGGEAPPAGQVPVPADLEQIALHNAVEGCVAETWAALAAVWKGQHARTPTLRLAYARIAVDELRHAQLAWDLHGWLLGQLDDDARLRVEAAQAAALAALPARAAAQARQLPTALGMPTPAQAAQVAARLGSALLAA